MYENKEEIIKALTPKAILMPLTKEASAATGKSQCQKGIISIMEFPFRVGRESRIGENSRGLFLKFRVKNSDSYPNNDIYLVDDGRNIQISKEHFQIEKTNNFYLLKDRASNTGTTINDITYGGNQEEEQVLNDGDIVKIGSSDSLYKYQFIVLN